MIEGKSPEPAVEASSPIAGSITTAMIEHLRRTQVWVRLLSILGFIVGAITVVIGLGYCVVTVSSGRENAWLLAVPMLLALLLVSGLYLFPSMYLFRYATAISRVRNIGDQAPLEVALSTQRAFWRVLAIATLIVFGLYCVVLPLAIAVGVWTRPQ